MLIQPEFDDKNNKINKSFKGIEIKKCVKISMEEYILYLFQTKLKKLPIAQNVLICINETTIEEIQSFFYRAILCEFNTLFVVEIYESFSNFQHNKMYSYISKLLSIKFEKYKNENKEKKKNIISFDNLKSRDYLDSYIVFVYKKLENENAFRHELGKYIGKIEKKDDEEKAKEEQEKNEDDINVSKTEDNEINESEQDDDLLKSKIIISEEFEIINNIRVISSDICGLGKSFYIKNEIEQENEKKEEEEKTKLYHFPLGGKLTKNSIYQKIENLFKRIKADSRKNSKKSENNKNKDEKKKYSEFDNVAIHLDLIETKETSLINEFLFSFLITRFYTNNQNIIYIPNNLKIYIEVPNSFENYLTKFGILNAFNRENIVFGKIDPNKTNQTNPKDVSMLPLKLDDNTKKQFLRLNGYDDINEIENFIKETFDSIEIKEYSYHQIHTFIKLYISQFESFKGKLSFKDIKGNDITPKCIKHFSNSTKYFTNGGFAKLIMKKKQIKDIFELCLEASDNDLNKENFDYPLIYIDKKTKKFKLEKLPDINKDENKGKKK